MSKMTPEQEAAYAEAAYALDNDLSRADLSSPAQQEYDRLKEIPKIMRWAAETSGRDSFSMARPVTIGKQKTPAGKLNGYSNCSGCGEELTPNGRFCASCGEPAGMSAQDTRCRGCGEELTPNARFCALCGEPINMPSAGQSSIRGNVGQPDASAEKTLQDFTVKFVTFYDGSGHRLGSSECTLTSRRLIINDARGGIHQILLRDISGISTPSRMVAPKMLRISLPAQAYDIDCASKDQKLAMEAWLGRAIRESLS